MLLKAHEEAKLRRRMANALAHLLGRPLIPPHAVIGQGVYIGRTVVLDWRHAHLITIRDHATVVDGTRILCHDASSNRRQALTWVAPVTIGERAFVGADSLILPGVSIGADAVVAAGSVVSRDVPAGTVVAGVPAHPIGMVADLDAERQSLTRTRPVFSEAEFHHADLSPEQIEKLRAAGEAGGYFLGSRVNL
jgi:acetyltransferase-like isoleucine patch superfamily enzyme